MNFLKKLLARRIFRKKNFMNIIRLFFTMTAILSVAQGLAAA
ncbi:MAG: hypothetical protein QM529_00400 [Hydrotalea sp.]|nr:hypothetical protein [Hydrotalea sp.]